MSKATRWMVAGAALALLLVYFFPLWTIALEAPQYPEGLGMQIWVDDVAGEGPHDLRNINNLNHYIGMKEIHAESIPELRFMPWIVAILALGGLAVAATGSRKALYLWAGTFVLVALAGLVDFWWWEYDYGHNLDQDRAIIKIPGMSYQPPLIGSKRILNFTAHAWPGPGGWAAILAGGLAVGAAALEWWRGRRGRRGPEEARSAPDPDGPRPEGRAKGRRAGRERAVPVALLFVALLAACAPSGPREAVLGEDVCGHCHMTVVDPRFVAEAVTPRGKVRLFDSVECLAEHVLAGDAAEVGTVWVAPFDDPARLVRAEDALFFQGRQIRSPMGAGLVAFAPGGLTADQLQNAFGPGEVLGWEAVLERVGSRQAGRHGVADHPVAPASPVGG